MFDFCTLPGGLRVAGEYLPHVRSCTVGVWVRVGSMNERPQENGLSHFIEHMVFKGTQNRSARDIAEEMDLAGGQLNAFTSKECTCYYAKVTDDELPLAVDILSDLALRPVFDARELDKERGVVLEEIAMVEDTPEDLVHELLSDAQYTGSLRRPILGTADLIRGYGREALEGYWARHYTPENMVLAISGNYDWNAFLELVHRYFSPFANLSGDTQTLEAQTFVPGRLAREKDTEQTHICLGFPGVPSDSDELYALSVLSNALGGGMSSRLFQRIREELGMAYSVYTYASSYRGLGSFNVYAGTTPDNAPTVLHELQSQLSLFLRDGLTDKEFKSAKAQLRGGFLLGLESSSGRMQALGRGHLLLGRVRTQEETLARIEAVTPENVMSLARRLLAQKPSAAIVGRDAQKLLTKIGGDLLG